MGVRTDSHKIIEWIKGGILPRGSMKRVIVECQNWVGRNWEIHIKHVYREQNKVTNISAKVVTQGRDPQSEGEGD